MCNALTFGWIWGGGGNLSHCTFTKIISSLILTYGFSRWPMMKEMTWRDTVFIRIKQWFLYTNLMEKHKTIACPESTSDWPGWKNMPQRRDLEIDSCIALPDKATLKQSVCQLTGSAASVTLPTQGSVLLPVSILLQGPWKRLKSNWTAGGNSSPLRSEGLPLHGAFHVFPVVIQRIEAGQHQPCDATPCYST